jgi:chromosome segregation ATPase
MLMTTPSAAERVSLSLFMLEAEVRLLGEDIEALKAEKLPTLAVDELEEAIQDLGAVNAWADGLCDELRAANAEIRATKSKLKEAEDTLAEIDFDVFAMEEDYLKLRAENEALKTENARLTEARKQPDGYVWLP